MQSFLINTYEGKLNQIKKGMHYSGERLLYVTVSMEKQRKEIM